MAGAVQRSRRSGGCSRRRPVSTVAAHPRCVSDRRTGNARMRRPSAGQCWQPRQYDVMKPPARTSVIRVPQRGHGWPPLSWTARKSRTCFSKVGGTRSRRTAIASASVERVASYRASTSSAASDERLRNGSRLGGVQDLVAVGVADPGHERLVAQQVLELARMAPDPVPPDLEGQGRDRRRRGPGPARRGPGTGRSTPAGCEVDLAHLGRVAVADLRPGVVGRQPGGAARPARRVARAGRSADRSRARRPSWPGSLSPGAASWNRPVSIGLQAIASRSRSISRNLPRRRMRLDALADEGGQLGRRASDGERARAPPPDRTGRPARAAWRASATTVRSGNSGTARRL